MANNNDSNGANSSNDPKRERIRQEAQVLVEFTRALQSQVQKLRDQVGRNGKIGLGEKEMEAVNSIVRAGNMEGLIAGIATFVFLRRFPKYLRQRALRREAEEAQRQQFGGGGGGGGYTLDSPFRPPNNMQQQPNPIVQQAQAQAGGGGGGNPDGGGLIWRTFQFSLDVVLSTLVGLQVTAYMMDRRQLKKTISEIPLVEGHSAISNHFCPVLINEYKRQWQYDPNNDSSIEDESSSLSGMQQEQQGNNNNKPKRKPLPPFDRKEILNNPEMDALQGLLAFTKNCMKRQALERRIRQERGMSPNEPVSIPSPGVTSSEWSSDGDDDGTIMDEEDGNFFSDSSSNDSYHNSGEKFLSGDDDEWTKEVVSDQEDSKK